MTDPVPALDTLAADQRVLYEDLEAGFSSRVDVVLWCHKAHVRTLGQLPDSWSRELLGDRYRVAALLDDDCERGRATKYAPDDQRARRERQMIGDDQLLTACRDAMQLLGEFAQEHPDDESIDGPQRYLAMRPALDDLVRRQRGSLKRVLGRDGNPGGLQSHDEISSWVRGVIRSTKGVDGGISRSAMWDLFWRSALLGDPSSPSLHLLLAEDVISVMNRSIRETATASREAVEEDRVTHGPLDT
ncbi:hypothetical protein [Salinigranum rubrum]|uniref:hypothetical protein n=1 Tax=Salinigranum rubrum TaxID=755307 RepID=UPI0013A563DF|nr:hypothetical protein [Salinigranum rubrum]